MARNKPITAGDLGVIGSALSTFGTLAEDAAKRLDAALQKNETAAPGERVDVPVVTEAMLAAALKASRAFVAYSGSLAMAFAKQSRGD